MKTAVAGLLSLLLMVSSTGCACLYGIEQWKCDTFGCCMFGTRPSCGYGCGPVYGGGAPCGPCAPTAPCSPCGPCQTGMYGMPSTSYMVPGPIYGAPVQNYPGAVPAY